MKKGTGVGRARAAIAALLVVPACVALDDATVRVGEPVGSAQAALPTDGQVCVVIQRGVWGVVEDATLWEVAPTWNDGASAYLWTGSNSAGWRSSLLRFETTSIPAQSTVMSAILSVSQGYKEADSTVRAHVVSAPWSEASVTWASFASTYSSAVAGSFVAEEGAGDRSLDITSLVQSWVDGEPNHGVLLEEDPILRTQFRSSEHPTVAQRPRLEVCYVTCSDGVQNGDETGIDVGGRCPSAALPGDLLTGLRFGDGAAQTSHSVALDSAGAPVIAATIDGTVDFGGGPIASIAPTGYGLTTVKLTASGSQAWVRQIGDAEGRIGHVVAVDGQGHVITAGSHAGVINLGGSPTDPNGIDVFVTKVAPTGETSWNKVFTYPQDQYVWGMATDTAANIVVTGAMGGAVSFGAGALYAESSSDAFVTKFGPTGTCLWSRRYGGVDGYHRGNSVATDSGGNIVIAGLFTESIDLGDGTLTIPNYYGEDSFVLKLDAGGNRLWSKIYGGALQQQARSIATDGAGNVLVTGCFQEVVNFGGGGLYSPNSLDIFLAKLSPAGDHIWSKRFGDGAHAQCTWAVTADGAGNVIIAGSFEGTVDFGGGVLTSAGGLDIFVAKFDAAGNHLWSRRYGDAGQQEAFSVAVDASNNVFLTGYFEGTVDFGVGPVVSAGSYDIFLVKLAP